jgi:myo-inositol-1(or 4)-monophosphatase
LYNKELEIAKKAALLSGSMLKEFKNDLNVEYKSTKDIVTKADIKSQSIIVDTIKETFPDDNFLTEESDKHILKENRTWVIDPLDGTVNYSRDIPFYGVSIALFDKGSIVLGVIYLPVFDELYFAEKGQGAFFNDKKINCSSVSDISKSIFNFNDFNIGEINKLENYNQQKVNLVEIIHDKCMRLKNFSSAVSEFAFLASGKIDAYFMIFCGYWDIAAGLLLVEEAGGKVSTFDGSKIEFNSKYILASNCILHEELIKNLSIIEK